MKKGLAPLTVEEESWSTKKIKGERTPVKSSSMIEMFVWFNLFLKIVSVQQWGNKALENTTSPVDKNIAKMSTHMEKIFGSSIFLSPGK